MEDGTEEIQNIVFSEKRSFGGPNADEEAEQRIEKRDESKELGGEQERASGMINNLISSLVSGGGGDDDQDEEEKHDEDKRSGMTDERKEEENNKEGSLINHIISNLVSPTITSHGEVHHKIKAGDDDQFELQSKEEGKSGGGGGIINNLISNIFHHQDRTDDEGTEKVKPEVGGGGGLVECLVSNLPTPLAEDAAPATNDEASILIHSIVHD